MALLGNNTFLGNVQALLAGSIQLPFLGRPTPVAPAASIAWDGCINLDLGVDQGDLLFPIQCARLDVPLDYTDPGNDTTTEIQLLRVPATVSPSRGSVIINPGGPGESGCDYLALRASRFHAILGGQFDLVSFDPRGTGAIKPFSCTYMAPAVSISDVSRIYRHNIEEILEEKRELYHTAAKECHETELENGRFMSTAFLARDMLQIIDALGEDLSYWGSSYGTVLGMTFAAMFPDRVERMMLDATVNPHEYMAGTTLEMLRDADKAYSAFLEECMAAPEECVLAATADNALNLSHSINAMLQQVLDVQGSSLYREIKNDIIYRGLYWPDTWSRLAATLLQFVDGDFSSLKVESDPTTEPFEYNKGGAAIFGTRCGDSALRAAEASKLTDLILQYQEVSSFADVNIATSITCATWNIKPAERYTGNFTATTAHPIIFVNGLYDPAAPLASAMNASAGFDGSRVLIHDDYGHGLSAHPNLCVGRTIRQYFTTGEMPAHGYICPRETPPFGIDIRAWQKNVELLDIQE